MEKLTADRVQAIVAQIYEDGLNGIESYFTDSVKILSPTDIDNQLEVSKDLEAENREALATRDHTHIRPHADRLLGDLGITADHAAPEYRKLCHELLKAYIKLSHIERKRMVGDYSDEPFPYPPPAPQPLPVVPVPAPEPKRSKKQRASLEQVYERYSSEQIKAGNWKQTTIKEYTSVFKTLSAIFGGETEVHTIDRQCMVECKDILCRMPKGMLKTKKYQGLTPQQAIELMEEDEETLSLKRVNGYLTKMRTIFKYAVHHGYMDLNPAEGLNIKIKARADKQRNPFDPEDLRRIFTHEDFRNDTFKRGFMFWLPVLALFTGGRIEELSQLYLDDVKEIEGLWCLDINDDPGTGKSLKNLNSKRIIPLHPFIVENLNFPGYVEALRSQGHERVFPKLRKTQDKFSHYSSRIWNKWKKEEVGIIAVSGDKTFHSFRHTVITQLKHKLVSKNIIQELAGHAEEGETMGRYGKRYTPDILYKEAILKLEYEGLDLSYLERSRFVVGRD